MKSYEKLKKINYFYAFLIALVFAGVLFVFANKLDVNSSVVPFVLVTLFDIANVINVRRAAPRDCFVPFFVSSLTVFVLYKIVSVSSFLGMMESDGFLTDGEFAHSYGLDILMGSLVISSFIFNVILRFFISKQKLRNISRVSRRRFGITFGGLILIFALSVASWSLAAPYKEEYLDYVSTFSSEKWEAFPQSRINMYEDFEKNYGSTVFSADKIAELLGEPDFEEENAYGYYLGDNENGHNKLYIKFEGDWVSSYELKTEPYIAVEDK